MFTVEQWAAMPDTRPHDELVDGKAIQKMTTDTAHAWAAANLLCVLKSRGDTHGWTFLPEGTSIKLGEYGGAVPDVVGFSPEQELRAEADYYEHPFFVAEILSKGTAKRDAPAKFPAMLRLVCNYTSSLTRWRAKLKFTVCRTALLVCLRYSKTAMCGSA
jgi:Uma2 family endonuclease